MDPFDEFEFKPLTDGLGFHKKKTPAKPEVDPSVDSFSNKSLIKNHGLELIEEGSVDPMRPPLPRKGKVSTPDLTEIGGAPNPSASSAVDEILKTLQKNKHLDFEKSKATKVKTQKAEEYKLTNWNFSSGLLDGMLVVAASLLCMIILLMITRVDLIGNLTHPDSQGMIYLATFTLFAGVSFIYLLVNRVFLGYTPGEWAFDQRIGKPEETNTAMYTLRVAARSALVIVTGFIVFPILSLIFGYDVAGAITGARLMKKA